MIQTPEQFDAALDAATRLLDAPPAEGSPAYERMMLLMKDIAAYRPRIHAAATLDPAPISEPERRRLAARLDAFEARVTPHYAGHWAAMVGGDIRPHASSAG